MIYKDVIIIGGGPAGSTCAWQLRKAGHDVLVLDKQAFPRQKLCAGWITPRVLRLLELSPTGYPFGLTYFNKLHFYIRGRHVPVPTRQYAIRRFEFDAWLLQRANVPVKIHTVHKINPSENSYTIDDKFQCRILVGAGGTACPVYRSFFKYDQPRLKSEQITTLELEFQFDYRDKCCRLWFFDNDLPGYSWSVPKTNGFINIGIGGKSAVLKKRGETIQEHWAAFVDKLVYQGFTSRQPLKPKGCTYYIGQRSTKLGKDNVYIIGDSAGLATFDMGEGIGPAVESGIRAAKAILSHRPIRSLGRPRLSAPGILFPW